MIRRHIFTATALAATIVAMADMPVALDDVVVTTSRPMSRIGMQITPIDSVALRENISLSMADVIGFNSSVFVKTSGRATLSTVSFRGTAPSHTAVTWNGLPVNSPALGMTDFSLIPAYFVDHTLLLHGTSSLRSGAGALGGAVEMSTDIGTDLQRRASVQYVQGVGSFDTYDEFVRVGWGNGRVGLSTRAVLSTSDNDFTFTNHDRKDNIYDDNHQIIGQYYPRQRNRNGAYSDFHVLQQAAWRIGSADRVAADVWYTGSNREIPLTTVDYLDTRVYERRQRENTLRSTLQWHHSGEHSRTNVRAGYVHSWMAYDYALSLSPDVMQSMTASRTHIDTWSGDVATMWFVRRNLHLSAMASVTYNSLRTADAAALAGALGFDKHRAECGASIEGRWQPVRGVGVTALLRSQLTGRKFAPLIPALLVDWVAWRPASLTLKASASRNYHAPTLNDLYFVPGGNPDLTEERGRTFDVGASALRQLGAVTVGAGATWFDSQIDDWILWLPTNKGFFSPRNLRCVHSYGVEFSASAAVSPVDDLNIDVNVSGAWTASLNNSAPAGPHDQSASRQLPYVPRLSGSATAGVQWRRWSLLWKWQYYSRRYTMTSNESTVSASLPPYLLSCISLERGLSWPWLDLSARVAVNNLFDADYQTIMSHPMPGINFEVFLSITPKL